MREVSKTDIPLPAVKGKMEEKEGQFA